LWAWIYRLQVRTLGQRMWDKVRSYWEHVKEPIGNLMGIQWEQIENKKNWTSQPSPHKRKTNMGCMLHHLIGSRNCVLLTCVLCNFWPRLNGIVFNDHVLMAMEAAVPPPIAKAPFHNHGNFSFPFFSPRGHIQGGENQLPFATLFILLCFIWPPTRFYLFGVTSNWNWYMGDFFGILCMVVHALFQGQF
jgi:hypothetical protein